MVRVAIIVFILIFAALGVGVYFGLRAVREHNVEKAEEVASTSTEVQAKGSGLFGFLRKDYLSKESFQKKEFGFQLNRSSEFDISLEGMSVPLSDDASSGFVLRRSGGGFSASSSYAAYSSQTSSWAEPPFGFTKEDLSPFFDRVVISSLRYPRKSDYDMTSIQLFARTTVGVSGWKIKTHSGDVSIPLAIEKYAPGSSLEKNIVLQEGQTLSLFGHYRFATYQHAFGKNLRLNQCTGYLNNLYTFDPKLPERCPRIDREALSAFSGACQSFLLRLGTCAVPTSAQISEFQGDAACQSFMRNKF